MSDAVAGAIITATFLLLTSTTFLLLLDTWTDQSRESSEAARRYAELMDSSIAIRATDPLASDPGCGSFTAQVENTGGVAIADFSRLDVLVEYTDESDSPVSSYLEYATDWSVTGITPDTRDPEVWNTQETATLAFTLDPVMQLETYANLVVVDAQGVLDMTYFYCTKTLYLHSETEDIAGTDYFRIGGTPPDGVATTITSTISAGVTGRVRPTANNGKFVLPLTNTTRVQATDWEVTYRVKRNQADFGFLWFTDAVDISLAATGSWEDIDLSAVLPAEATGAMVEIVNTGSSSDNSGVVRGKEDTRDYMSDPLFQEIQAATHRYQMVKLDSDRLMQGFIEDAEIDFKLLGYTLGDDPDYFAIPEDITPGTTGGWTPVDVSSYVDADADGVILFVDSVSATDQAYGIREVGSSYSTTSLELEEYGNTMYLVGIDAANQFEAYLQSADVKIYLVAQTKGSVVYYTDDTDVSDPTTDSWQSVDAATYSVADEANGLILRAENTSILLPQRISFRHGDSTDDWNGDLSLGTHLQAAVGLNSANLWGEFMEGILGLPNADLSVAIAGYTRLVRFEVHADLDALIRQADGTVRATLSTDAANTSEITETGWQTLTGTLTSPGHTVVDQTDYLEIDLFAEVTSNESGEEVSVDFRIDDPDLELADQAKIDP